MPDDLAELGKVLAAHGLVLRGGFNFARGEDAPKGLTDRPALAVMLVGTAGADYWRHFRQWCGAQATEPADPLDRWSREIIGSAATGVGARAVSPSDRPYLPFQSWAMRAEGLRVSPLGILMHPRYGLWHAYRGALLFDVEIAIEEAPEPNHLCGACAGQFCRKACPVDAHQGAGFAYQSCLDHARGDGSACRSGCLDRNACPAAEAYRYPPEVQAFHQAAFLD